MVRNVHDRLRREAEAVAGEMAGSYETLSIGGGWNFGEQRELQPGRAG
jgi:hypothetical protein